MMKSKESITLYQFFLPAIVLALCLQGYSLYIIANWETVPLFSYHDTYFMPVEEMSFKKNQEEQIEVKEGETEELEPIEQAEGEKETPGLEDEAFLGMTAEATDPSGEEMNSVDEGLWDQNLNSYVLQVIETYTLAPGKYPYLLNEDYARYNGVTEDLIYRDKIVLKAHPNKSRASHCVGITFEVFFKAMQERNRQLGLSIDDFNGMTWNELYDMALTWFGASGQKQYHNLAVAIEKYGVGKSIKNLEEARPGDFMDISRENNTGHTVVFIDWIRDEGKIIGIKYWSSQGSTNGISYKQEYFNVLDKEGNQLGNVLTDQVYIGRVLSVNEYKKYIN